MRTCFFVRNKKIYIQYNTVYNFLSRKENRKIWLLYKIAGKENESKMCTRKKVTRRVECWPRLMPNPQAKSRPCVRARVRSCVRASGCGCVCVR